MTSIELFYYFYTFMGVLIIFFFFLLERWDVTRVYVLKTQTNFTSAVLTFSRFNELSIAYGS